MECVLCKRTSLCQPVLAFTSNGIGLIWPQVTQACKKALSFCLIDGVEWLKVRGADICSGSKTAYRKRLSERLL